MERPLDFDELAPLVGQAWVCGDGCAVAHLDFAESGNRQRARIVVAGSDVAVEGDAGNGVSRLLRLGIAAVIGRSFSPSFFRAAVDAGLPALVIEETDAVCPDDRLRIDIEQRKIANLSSGDRYIIRNLYDESLDVLRAGGRRAYEARRRALATGPRR